ncbi:MAG: DUF1572 domain-containing protein [Acidobacteriia bacterium]|nr:DUF1572 domain-containing protein [Terriglobia bacterium]
MIEEAFLKYSADELLVLSGRILDCLGRLTAEQVWTRGSDNENSVGNLVLHLCGNVRQWIISGVGGAADVRDRDSEFAARGGMQPAELAAKLKAVVGDAADVIRKLPVERLGERKTIQKIYETTLMEAVYHVVEHFAQHTGQIVFATKLLTSADLGYYKHLSKSA